MRVTDGSDFPTQQQSNKERAIAHAVHRMYSIEEHLASQPSSKNCSREMKTTFAASLRTIRVEESFHNAGVKIRAEHAWKFSKNCSRQHTKFTSRQKNCARHPCPGDDVGSIMP